MLLLLVLYQTLLFFQGLAMIVIAVWVAITHQYQCVILPAEGTYLSKRRSVLCNSDFFLSPFTKSNGDIASVCLYMVRFPSFLRRHGRNGSKCGMLMYPDDRQKRFNFGWYWPNFGFLVAKASKNLFWPPYTTVCFVRMSGSASFN